MQADFGKNYFELFGLPATFELDPVELGSRYRSLQRQFHPDRFASAPESDRRRSMQMTAQINAAYQTLRDEVARGRYLLGLRGVSTDEETDTRMDPAFLMEQMELREALDEARTAADSSARYENLRGNVDDMLSGRSALLRECFSDESPAALQKARRVVREMQFLQKLADEIASLD